MGILKAAIAAGNWDLAAHALVLAALQTLNGETENAEKKDPQEKLTDNQEISLV